MARIEYKLEYPLGKVSPKQLWLMMTTPIGLSTWIDAEISINDNIATFSWSPESADTAKMTILGQEQRVLFKWIEEEGGFELQILTSELTQEITLKILDSCLPEDYDSSCQIWNQQIQALHRALGLPV